jgi:hypothetical protein
MAEFKLGRIRFVWKGTWTPSVSYLIDDVISNGGKSYICVVNHTSASLFDTDLDFSPTRWNIVSDGTQWNGDWTPGTYYNPGAVVKYGALVYICKTGHTSATYVPPTYLGLEDDLEKWEIFATSFDWQGPWTTSTRYKLNDFIVYGGTTYVCTEGHVSAATAALGLEDDSDKWDIFNQGVTYLGDWNGATVRYRQNDVVKYGASLWICTVYHTSSASFDLTKWSIFVEGFEFENSWNNSTTYQQGDVVTYGGYSYVAQINNINKQPTSNPSEWSVFTTGFSFVGEWNVGTSYKVGSVVRNGGYTYLAKLDSIAQSTDNTTYWDLLNNGFRWTSNPQTYLAVGSVAATGLGQGAKFDVTRSSTVYTVSLASGFSGLDYAVGNKIKILGSLVGGTTQANDITLTVTGITGGGATGPLSTFTWVGGAVSWTSSIDYVLGDIVSFSANSYICIDAHTSSSLNRPDADITGAYWNLLTAGAEYNILTDTGDLVYFSANGPARLPVGTNGQVLRSQDGFPVWANYGLINNLVYVGPLGRDVAYPDAGATIDQPWRSVRFATKQIEDGYLNPNAKLLLAKNKQFIMKEITNWVIYTYTVDITAADATDDFFTCDTTAPLSVGMPIEFSGTVGGVTAGQKYFVRTIVNSTTFKISALLGGSIVQLNNQTASMTGTLSYDRAFCERDVGLIVEALKHDITHGGNSKTTIATKAYYTAAGNAYINSNFGTQKTQTIAAYTYLSTLVTNVLNNVPWRSYQIFNGITTGEVQIIDTSLTVEPEVVDTAQALISIITTGINVGNSSSIPTPIYPNTTISVKTGTFAEVLPMVISPFTAVVGDELRSTVIQPARANPLLVNDKAKTTSALNRISAIAGDLIQNVAVTPTSGNTETQLYVSGYAGSSTVTTAVGTKTAVVSAILAGGLPAIPTLVLPDPTGYAAGFFNARRLLVANTAFIKAEVSAWITARIAANTAPFVGITYGTTKRTAVETEIGYIIDALRYDITYGGNLETLVAARSAYSLGTYVGSLEKAPFVAVLTYLRSIISYIAEGDNTLGGLFKTPGNAQNQVDTTPWGSAVAGAFLEDRLQEIKDYVDTTILPLTIEPSVTWVASGLVAARNTILSLKAGIQAGAIEYISSTYTSLVYNTELCARDVGYIVDAVAYDVMFGGNFRSIKAGMRYYSGTTSAQFVIANQLAATQATITFIDTAIKQITNGQAGSAGSELAVSRVESSANVIYDIVASGLGAVPTLVLADPVGYDVNFSRARAQIVQNYAFIRAEIAAFLNVNYNAVWVALGATGQAGCARDIGYILDGVRYDITYGGNTQSLIVGSAYYSNYSSTIDLGEIAATVAAYTRIKTIIGQIAQAQSVTVTPGNVVSQVGVGVNGGNAASATFAQARVQDVIDWINNGTGNATIAPSIAWATTALQTAFTELQSKKAEIVADVTWWVYKNYQNINFNEELCARDTGYMVDALSYDAVFGSNFAAITAGRALQRATVSATVVTTIQRQAELGAINFLKYKAKSVASTGAVALTRSIIADMVGTINGGAIPRTQWTNPSTITSAYAAATVLLRDNKTFIQSEIVAWVNINYPSTRYSDAEYSRDVGYIVEALVYDLTYGYGVGNIGKIATLIAGESYYSALTNALQIDSGDVTATVAAYNRLKSVAQSVVQDTAVSASAGNTVSQVRAVSGQTVGSAATATAVGTLVDVITNIITNGLTTGVPRVTISAVAGGTTFTSGTHNLAVGDVVIPQSTPTTGNGGFGLVSGTRYYVASTPLGTTFTLAAYQGGPALTTFTNGTGLSLLVEINNLPSTSWVVAGLVTQRNALQATKATIRGQVTTYIATYFPTLSYNSATCERDVGLIIDYIAYDMMFDSNYLTITSARSYFRAQAALVQGSQKAATIAAFRYLKNLIVDVVVDNATASRRLKILMDIIIDSLSDGIGSTAEVVGTVTYKNDTGVFNGAEVLRLNRTFLASEATAWIKLNFGGTVTSTTATTNVYTTSAVHNLTVGDPVVFSGTVITASGVTAGTTYYVLTTPTAQSITITATQGGTTAVDVTANGTGSMAVRYAIDEPLFKLDMEEYIDGIVYDLGYTGNYRSLRAVESYNNEVNGSELANMFYVSNGTGLRNCTLNGLNGTLTEENDFGTKRPTAGAYVALNPGFGPNDSNVWVQQRSHYSQNVSLFGTGCSGAKIDGAIHAGGNRSMVKNDFTTIISDGFGVWCTGANSLTELVSVFNYFGYAGYMAELGGRIRATNGNSSYGTYGVIAEGTDTYEQPIFAVVDNASQQAVISDTIVNAIAGNVLRVEFNNAGTNYTNVDIGISGDGINAITIGDEFRDGAIFETRVIDLDNGQGFGGTNYINAINAAQEGDTASITIANSDIALSTAYPTMRIQITAGSGVGQFANILDYNNGTKVAKVIKDSFTALTVTATAITNNLLTVASTATITPGQQIYLGGTANGVTANTLYYVRTANFSATQFSVSLTGAAGTAVTISANGSVSIPLYAAGWDHVIPGTAISAGLDLTSTYIIEPRISYTAPGYTATSRTIPSAAYKAVTFGNGRYVAVGSSGTTTAYSLNGKTWAAGGALSASASWTDMVFGGGQGAVATARVGGLGGAGAVLSVTMGAVNSVGDPGIDQVLSVQVIDGGFNYTTPPSIVFTGSGLGASATCTVLNGKIDAVTIVSNGSGYSTPPTVTAVSSKITKMDISSWGRGYTAAPTVTLSAPYTATAWSSGGAATSGSYYSYAYTVSLDTITNYYRADGSGSFSATPPQFTSGTGSAGTFGVGLTYVGTLARGTAVLNNTGVSSITINDAGFGYTSTPTISIVDTSAKFVAIANGSTSSSYLPASAAVGAAWTAGGALTTTTMVGIAYGNGLYVTVGGTASASSSTTGTSWVSRTLPTLASGTYSAVAFGNGYFVATSTGSNATAVSSNGTIWIAGGNLPSSTTWTSVAYGNGRFVAIANGPSRTVAYSINNGTTWTAANPGLPSSQSWIKVKYAQGLFIALAAGSTVCATSQDGINWVERTMPGASSNWSDLAFGNVNSDPLWVAVTTTTGTVAASLNTGARALARMRVINGTIFEVRMVEPGSAYPKGTVTATTATTNIISTSNTENLVANQPVVFSGCDAGGLLTEKLYYVIGASIVANTSFQVSLVSGSGVAVVLTTVTGLTGKYRAGAIATQFDPNRVISAALNPRAGDGVLGNPSFSNRGSVYTVATTVANGDGAANLYQPSTFIAVRNLYSTPQAGSNVVFGSIPGIWYKLVAVTNVLGDPGDYTATFQISPGISVLKAPIDADSVTTTIKYSQVRLTGHDFLYIGTGNQADTNYPFVNPANADINKQTVGSGGGRVFFTSTDQDGNFNVGGLFGVQQSTGTATLNADAFNLSGLQSLQLGSLNIGTGSAIINQFSTDPYFTADSDNIVPTQRAIKAYITAQIGGGQSSLNVNTLTAGVVYIANNSISTTSGGQLNIKAKMNFTGGIDGAPVALAFFMQR